MKLFIAMFIAVFLRVSYGRFVLWEAPILWGKVMGVTLVNGEQNS
jgi:hypothetical protein